MTGKTFQITFILVLSLILLVGVFFVFKSSKDIGKSETQNKAVLNERNMVVVPYGEVEQLATLSLRVNGIEKTETISDVLFGTTQSKENTVFVLVDVSVTNTTNSTFTLYPNGILLSNHNGVTYDVFQATSGGAIGMEKRAIDGRDLGNGIEERGVIVYEVPNDFMPYALKIEKLDTTETLVFELERSDEVR